MVNGEDLRPLPMDADMFPATMSQTRCKRFSGALVVSSIVTLCMVGFSWKHQGTSANFDETIEETFYLGRMGSWCTGPEIGSHGPVGSLDSCKSACYDIAGCDYACWDDVSKKCATIGRCGQASPSSHLGYSSGASCYVRVGPPPNCDESMSGNGRNYKGCQTKTKTGATCMDWSQAPHSYDFNDLKLNYCRNPDGDSTIWCWTTERTTGGRNWGYCSPKWGRRLMEGAAVTSNETASAPSSVAHFQSSNEDFQEVQNVEITADTTLQDGGRTNLKTATMV